MKRLDRLPDMQYTHKGFSLTDCVCHFALVDEKTKKLNSGYCDHRPRRMRNAIRVFVEQFED